MYDRITEWIGCNILAEAFLLCPLGAKMDSNRSEVKDVHAVESKINARIRALTEVNDSLLIREIQKSRLTGPRPPKRSVLTSARYTRAKVQNSKRSFQKLGRNARPFPQSESKNGSGISTDEYRFQNATKPMGVPIGPRLKVSFYLRNLYIHQSPSTYFVFLTKKKHPRTYII